MWEATVARNYAEALFELGERHGETERYADLIRGLGAAIRDDPRVRAVLESPRVPKQTKQAILERALAGVAPPRFLRFLNGVVRRGRQGLVPAIADHYLALVDEKFNRVKVGVTLAREPDDALRRAVAEGLSAALGKIVIPEYRVDKALLGGVILRVGDRIMDGSLRRRLVTLRRLMLGA